MNEGLSVINNNRTGEVRVSVANCKQSVNAVVNLGLDIVRVRIDNSGTILPKVLLLTLGSDWWALVIEAHFVFRANVDHPRVGVFVRFHEVP